MQLVHRRLLQLGGLLVLGAGAAVGVYYQEEASNRAEAQKLASQRMMGFTDADAVNALELTTPTATFSLKREGSGENPWRVVAPEATLAEASTVEGIVHAALDLRAPSKVGEGEANGTLSLSLFNLEPPRYTLTLHTADGHQETLRVGKKNGFDGNLYVKREDAAAIGLVPATFEYQVDKDLFKLREKRLVPCDGEHVKNFTVTPAKGQAYTMERREKGFWMLAPRDTQADDGQVSAMAAALCGLRAKSFVRERTYPEELPRFGLGAPSFRVALTETSGKTHALRLGVVTLGGESHYFAMPEGEGPVIELASDWAFKKLETPAEKLRDMHVLSVDRDQVEGMSLYHGQDILTFVKRHDEASGVDSWHMTHPKDSGVQSAKVASLLYKLWNLRATRMVDENPSAGAMHKHGLEAPDLKVELTGKDGHSLGGIAFSAARGNERFATTDSGARIDAVATDVVDDIDTQADDYVQQPAANRD